MLLKARINIQNGTFEEWLAFFKVIVLKDRNTLKMKWLLRSERTRHKSRLRLLILMVLQSLVADDIRLREQELGVITAFID